jgi:hypothetical protein
MKLKLSLFLNACPWHENTWEKWRKTYIYISINSQPRHCMERNGQLHVPAALTQAIIFRYIWIESWVGPHIRHGRHAEETCFVPAANLTRYLGNTALAPVTTAKVSSLVPSKWQDNYDDKEYGKKASRNNPRYWRSICVVQGFQSFYQW